MLYVCYKNESNVVVVINKVKEMEFDKVLCRIFSDYDNFQIYVLELELLDLD